MLKLYYSPGACSLVPHVALEESGTPFETQRVVIAKGENLSREYLAVHPDGRVPALLTEDGVLTENLALLHFIADQLEGEGALPRGDAFEVAKAIELLGWFASSVHIAFAGIWRPARFAGDQGVHPILQRSGREAVERYIERINAACEGKKWLVGDSFTAVDTYILTFSRWAGLVGVDRSRYPAFQALAERVLQRDSVQRVIEREGLTPEDFKERASQVMDHHFLKAV
jgi:glutathione S-transferase